MTDKKREDRRSRVGYGSSYRKGRGKDLGKGSEIGAVMGGQVWMVKPDKDAQAANPCIWMQAGVVGTKSCNNFYDCTSCKYDLGMLKKVEKGKQISWQDVMRKRPLPSKSSKSLMCFTILGRITQNESGLQRYT